MQPSAALTHDRRCPTPVPWPSGSSTGSGSPRPGGAVAGLGAGGRGRIQRQLGQEALARRRRRRELLQLLEIAEAHARVVVQARRGAARTSGAPGPCCAGPGRGGVAEACEQLGEGGPVGARRRGRLEAGQRRRQREARAAPRGAPARRPAAGPSRAAAARPGSRPALSRGFSAQRRQARASLTCAASRKRSPPNFTNGMLRRPSSTSSASLWWAARNSTACWRSGTPASRRSRIALDDVVHLRQLVGDRGQQRARRRRRARREQLLVVALAGASAMTALAASRIGAVDR